MQPHAVPTCTVINVLQTGAAEGLAFLSGVAIAGQRMSWRQVAHNEERTPARRDGRPCLGGGPFRAAVHFGPHMTPAPWADLL
eukprot:scaffold3724_cov79-Isochrysis_galbana.AAC.1